MVRLSLCATLMIFASGSAFPDDIPFAAAPDLRPSSNNAYVPSLSEIMLIVQLKHIKLWQAGAAPNWRLAGFQVDQIRDMFLKAAIFYRDIPASYVVAVEAPLAKMKAASAAGDAKGFVAAYAKLTAACNACHQAANVGFIVLKTPTSSPFADEKF